MYIHLFFKWSCKHSEKISPIKVLSKFTQQFPTFLKFCNDGSATKCVPDY